MIAIGSDHGGYQLKENIKIMGQIVKKGQIIQYMQKKLQKQFKTERQIKEF